MVNNKAILLFATAFLAVSSFLMIGGISFQIAEASGPNCPSKGGAAAIVDPNAPNAVNIDAPLTLQPVI